MKKFLLVIFPLLLLDFLLAGASFAATPTPTEKPDEGKKTITTNPAPPIGVTCGNTVCLAGESCVMYPGDDDEHCVPDDFDPLDPGAVGKKVPPMCNGTGVYQPNSSCWNTFKSVQTDLNKFEKTCIYEPVARYEASRYLHGSTDDQPFEMCGIGDSGPGGPPAPGGSNPDCAIAMLVYTDVRDAELGSYGPSTEAQSTYSTDFIAQNYLYNSLFDRPTDLSDTNREAYRTYWRLLPANNQANLRSFVLNMAHDDLIVNTKFDFTDTNGLKKQTNFKSLYDALSKQVILFFHFPFIRIGCLTSYPVCPEYAQAMGNLKPILQDLTDTALELNIPGATAAIQAYNVAIAAFGGDLDGPYAAFVPLDFSSTRGYIVKKKDEVEEGYYNKYERWLKDTYNKPRYGTDRPQITNVSRENLPYVGAIYQGLLSPKFGMLPALQPQWIVDKYATPSGISDYKIGNKAEDFPEIKIAKRNIAETIKEEALAIVSSPIGWISDKVRSFFTPEDKKKGYNDLDVDNTDEQVRQVYDNPQGCPLEVSYHLLSPKTAADAKGTPIKPLDDHHQVIWIRGPSLAWNFTPESRPLYEYSCDTIKRPNGTKVQDCGLKYKPCPSDDEHYVLGSTCYRRKWAVEGTKHGKGLNVVNNPIQTDIKETIAANDSFSFFKMMLPDGKAKLPPDANIDAPLAKNFVSYLTTGGGTNDDGKTVIGDTATGPNGRSTILNPAEPINRINNQAQDTMHLLQNCWVVPDELQNSPRCDFAFSDIASPSACGTPPKLPAPSCKVKGNSLNLPPTLIKGIEAAGSAFKVPPALMIAVMYGEGAFNPGSKYLNESFIVENFPACAKLPDCSPTGDVSNNIVPFFSSYWKNLSDAVHKLDPNRESNACNLLDGIYALAKDLSQGQYGSEAFAGKTCFGIPLNAGSGASNSCSWSENSVETAIRVWEFGTAYTSAISCATASNSCLLGGGLAAQCPTGGDTCDTKGSRDPLPSHNACVMDVYLKNN